MSTMAVIERPLDIPDTWRWVGRNYHYVMTFKDHGDRVVTRYWSNTKGWVYEVVLIETLRFQFSLQADKVGV